MNKYYLLMFGGSAACLLAVATWFVLAFGDDYEDDVPELSCATQRDNKKNILPSVKKKRQNMQIRYNAKDVPHEVSPSSDGESADPIVIEEYKDSGNDRKNNEFEAMLQNVQGLTDRGGRPDVSAVKSFKDAFDALEEEDKISQIKHACVLLSDEAIDCLMSILMDVKEPEDVLSAVFYDICNRDDAVKFPILQEVSSSLRHPMAQEARDILTNR